MDDKNVVNQTETKGMGRSWRIISGIVAIIIIGILAFPFIRGQLNNSEIDAGQVEIADSISIYAKVTIQRSNELITAHIFFDQDVPPEQYIVFTLYDSNDQPLSESGYLAGAIEEECTPAADEIGFICIVNRAGENPNDVEKIKVESKPSELQEPLAGPQTTVQADPDSAAAWFKLGNVYYQAGRWELAIATYRKTIELSATHQSAYANLGATYYQQQHFDLAVSQYEKALKLNPKDGESAYNLGAIYLQLAISQSEQPDQALLNQAVDQIQTALQISPNLAEPHFSLGVAYMASNRRIEAIQAFETFLSLDTDQNSQARQDAERYLKFLRGQ